MTTDIESGTVFHQGCSLAYRVRGTGDPVLLIQGTGLHGDGWRPQVEALTGEYQCVTFDNRGMGASRPLTKPLTVAQMAEDALAVLDACGLDSAHVVGHSLGGLIALRLALTAPRRVRSLSLLCTFADGGAVTRPTPWMVWIGLRLRIGPRRARRRAFLEMIATPEQLAALDRDRWAEELAPLFGHDLGHQPPAVMNQLRAMGAVDQTPRLGELAGIPTLVSSAGQDRIAPPRLGRALAAGIPAARFVELPGAAHGVPITEPGRVNRLLQEHLAAVARSRPEGPTGPATKPGA
ncbi:MAG: alpha/beta fold hydrolase [Gemmatimonadales bacterium]